MATAEANKEQRLAEIKNLFEDFGREIKEPSTGKASESFLDKAIYVLSKGQVAAGKYDVAGEGQEVAQAAFVQLYKAIAEACVELQAVLLSELFVVSNQEKGKSMGQHLSPAEVGAIIKKITASEPQEPMGKKMKLISDPTGCGGGHLLFDAALEARRTGYQPLCYGCDLDSTAAKMVVIQAYIFGIPTIVRIGDVLDEYGSPREVYTCQRDMRTGDWLISYFGAEELAAFGLLEKNGQVGDYLYTLGRDSLLAEKFGKMRAIEAQLRKPR